MELTIFSTVALGLTTIFALWRIIVLKRRHERQLRILRRLERTVEKLNKSNGKLWYDLVRAQQPRFTKSDATGFTVTKQ